MTRATLLSPAESQRLRIAVQKAMADRHISAHDAALALGVTRRRIYAAIGDPFQPGLLIRLAEWLDVLAVTP